MTQRVLVTGAGGFVGSHLIQAMLHPAWRLVAVDSFRHNGSIDHVLEAITATGAPTAEVHVVVHDLVAPFSTRQTIELGDVDVIIDVASRSSVDESIADPREFVERNVAATLTTLELARVVRPQLYVHLSTDEVHGDLLAPCGVTDHRPSSPYAASKAAQDDVCHAYARTYGVPLVTVTCCNMFGERQSQLAFVPKIVRATLHGEPIVVHTRDGRPGSRYYNYVGDVAQRLNELLVDRELLVEREVNGSSARVPFAGRYHLNNRELAQYVSRLTRELAGVTHEVPILDLEATVVRPGYDARYDSLVDPATTSDPWTHPANLANAPLDDRLRRTVEWFVEHPTWLE